MIKHWLSSNYWYSEHDIKAVVHILKKWSGFKITNKKKKEKEKKNDAW